MWILLLERWFCWRIFINGNCFKFKPYLKTQPYGTVESNSCAQIFSLERNIRTKSSLYWNNICVSQVNSQVHFQKPLLLLKLWIQGHLFKQTPMKMTGCLVLTMLTASHGENAKATQRGDLNQQASKKASCTFSHQNGGFPMAEKTPLFPSFHHVWVYLHLSWEEGPKSSSPEVQQHHWSEYSSHILCIQYIWEHITRCKILTNPYYHSTDEQLRWHNAACRKRNQGWYFLQLVMQLSHVPWSVRSSRCYHMWLSLMEESTKDWWCLCTICFICIFACIEEECIGKGKQATQQDQNPARPPPPATCTAPQSALPFPPTPIWNSSSFALCLSVFPRFFANCSYFHLQTLLPLPLSWRRLRSPSPSSDKWFILHLFMRY